MWPSELKDTSGNMVKDNTSIDLKKIEEPHKRRCREFHVFVPQIPIVCLHCVMRCAKG